MLLFKNVKPASFLLFLFFLISQLSAQEITLSQLSVGNCTIRLQADFKWKVLIIRAHQPNFKPCRMTQATLIQLIKEAASKNDSVFQFHSFTSIFIGRAVEYPWLSAFMALKAKDDSLWSLKRGRPKEKNINHYVEKFLAQHEFLQEINPIFAKVHYRIKGVSVEKVLVGTYKNIPNYAGQKFKGGVPFDAQIYFLLQPLK